MAFNLHRRMTLAAGALALSLPGHGLHRLAGRPSPWVRRFLKLSATAFGLDVKVVGAPVSDHVLYVANHISWLDILALGGATGAAFVSKDDVARWPVVGWLAREGGTIFISRQDRKAVTGQADALATALSRGRPAVLFPEGTTGDGRILLPFRASLLASLDRVERDVFVQPVAIDYGEAAPLVAWSGGEPAGANAKRLLSRTGRIGVTLRFLDPIDPSIGRKGIARLAQEAIETALRNSGTLPPGHPSVH